MHQSEALRKQQGLHSSAIMQFYPQELITPPLTLVALLGKAELHSAFGEFLRAQYKPPINSVGLADPQHASRLFGKSQRCPLACAKASLGVSVVQANRNRAYQLPQLLWAS